MRLTEEVFQQLCENYAGYCPECDDVTCDWGVEPDAEECSCPFCEEDTVMGMDNALLMGHVHFVERLH